MNYLYIARLFELGHFFNPKYPNGHNITRADLKFLTLNDDVVKDAILSFQDMGQHLLRNFGSDVSGELDSATLALFEAPRCGQPDYTLSNKIGTGSWPEPCQKAGVTYSVNKSGIPSKFVTTWEEQILKPVIEDYANIGLKLIPVEGTGKANIKVSFRNFGGSTIGLAYFNNGSCSDSVTCELSTSYSPNEATEADLLKHEMGHCNGLGHTNGGTMNPFIINRDTYYKWTPSDPSWNTLVRYFGGEPIGPPAPKPAVVEAINIPAGIDRIQIDFKEAVLKTFLKNVQNDTYVLLNNKIL